MNLENEAKEELESDFNPMAQHYADPNINSYEHLDLSQQPGVVEAIKSTVGDGAYLVSSKVFTLYVSYIPSELQENGLYNLFGKFGTVLEGYFLPYKGTKYPYKKCAKVSYQSHLSAQAAVDNLHQTKPLHLRVVFEKSEEQKERYEKQNLAREVYFERVNELRELYERNEGLGKGWEHLPELRDGPARRLQLMLDKEYRDCFSNRRHHRRYGGITSDFDSDDVLSDKYRDGKTRNKCKRKKKKTKRETGVRESEWTTSHQNCIKIFGRPLIYPNEESSSSSGMCILCGQNSRLKCSSCFIWYCSLNCQIEDWSRHKTRCQRQSTDDQNEPLVVPFTYARLCPGKINEMYFGEIFSPSKFYLVNDKKVAGKVSCLAKKVSFWRILKPLEIAEGEMYCVSKDGSEWFRAQLLTKTAVLLMDHGKIVDFDLGQWKVAEIPQELRTFPFQTIKACLFEIGPPSMSLFYSKEVIDTFKNFLKGKNARVEPLAILRNGVAAVRLIGLKDLSGRDLIESLKFDNLVRKVNLEPGIHYFEYSVKNYRYLCRGEVRTEDDAVESIIGTKACDFTADDFATELITLDGKQQLFYDGVQIEYIDTADMYNKVILRSIHAQKALKDLDESLQSITLQTLEKPPTENQVVLCKWSKDDRIYRAEVLAYDNLKCIGKLYFLDYGNRALENINRMFEFPERFLSIPPLTQIFELKDVTPSPTYQPGIKLKLERLRPLLSFPMTLQITEDDEKVVVIHPNGKRMNQILEDKLRLSEDKLVGSIQGFQGSHFEYEMCHLAELSENKEEMQDVYVLSCRSPWYIFVCPLNQIGSALDLVPKIQAYASIYEDEQYGPPYGTVCLVKSLVDGAWYRGVVVNESLQTGATNFPEPLYRVFFADFGIFQEVTRRNVQIISSSLMKVPFLANHCVLSGYENSIESDEETDHFEELQSIVGQKISIRVCKKFESYYVIESPSLNLKTKDD